MKILSFDGIYRASYQPITSNIHFELSDQCLCTTNLDIIEGVDSALDLRKESIYCAMNGIFLNRIIRRASIASFQLSYKHPEVFIKFSKWLCDPVCRSITYENNYLSWRYFITHFRNPFTGIISNHRANRFLIIIGKINEL